MLSIKTFLDFLSKKLRIIIEKLISAAISFSIDKTDIETKRSLAIEDRKYVFMSFNFEKLRSPLATATGNVNNYLKAIQRFGNMSWSS